MGRAMIFNPIVIKAAQRLHELRPREPEEYHEYDWVLEKGYYPRPIETISETGVFWRGKHVIKIEDCIWIPHRATDFMEQPDWPEDWYLRAVNDNFQVVAPSVTSSKGKFVNAKATEFDPLTAAATAWLKAVEG